MTFPAIIAADEQRRIFIDAIIGAIADRIAVISQKIFLLRSYKHFFLFPAISGKLRFIAVIVNMAMRRCPVQYPADSNSSCIVRRIITDKNLIRNMSLGKKTPKLVCDILFASICSKND